MNVSKPSFIRVEADELTYDYHIMLRVEIEAELMDGSLEVAVSCSRACHILVVSVFIERGLLDENRTTSCHGLQDIPARWARGMEDSLGIVPPSDTLGCLQDVHWSAGFIGSFASYTIGNYLNIYNAGLAFFFRTETQCDAAQHTFLKYRLLGS